MSDSIEKLILCEVALSQPAMVMKNSARRELFFVAVLFITIALAGQAAANVETPCINENLIQQAMREEALRLLAQKVTAARNGAVTGFDYHIEQAYEKIKKNLPPEPLFDTELISWLRQFYQNPSVTDNDREFHTLIEQFVLGMSLEITNTLQYECDQAVDLIARIAKLAGEIKRTPHPNRETLDQALRQSHLHKKMYGIVKNIDRGWRIPPAGSDNFSAFNIWRKNITGQSLDNDQRLIFDLAGRYHPQYPFLEEFMGNYRRLAETFRQTVRDLNSILDSSNASDFKVFD
jgi:hypothetical protein